MEKRSVFWTLIPITQAAAITTVIMYPVDILRALKMASATVNDIFDYDNKSDTYSLFSREKSKQ